MSGKVDSSTPTSILRAGHSPVRETTRLAAMEILNAYQQQPVGIERIIGTAVNLVSSPDAASQCKGLELMRILVGRGHACNEAERAALDLIESADIQVRVECVNLFLILAENERALDSILQAVSNMIRSLALMAESAPLLATLIPRRSAVFEATFAAAELVRSQKETDQIAGLFLYEILIKEGRAFELAAPAAFSLYRSTTSEPVKNGALKLIKALWKIEAAIELTTTCASSLVRSGCKEKIERGRDLYLDLLDFKRSSSQAVLDAGFLAELDDPIAQSIGLQFLVDLVRVDQGLKEAERAAGARINSPDKTVQLKSFKLLRILVEKDQSFDMALTAVICFMRTSDEVLQSKVFSLLIALIKKGQSHEFALDTALCLYKSKEIYDHCQCLRLLAALVEQEQAYENASEMALVFANLSTDKFVQEKVIDVFLALVEKKQAFGNALEAAEMLASSGDVVVQQGALRLYNLLGKKI